MNEWDNQEKRKQEQEQLEASLYRSRSRLHGSGLTQDQQDETDFRRHFPQFSKVEISCSRTSARSSSHCRTTGLFVFVLQFLLVRFGLLIAVTEACSLPDSSQQHMQRLMGN